MCELGKGWRKSLAFSLSHTLWVHVSGSVCASTKTINKTKKGTVPPQRLQLCSLNVIIVYYFTVLMHELLRGKREVPPTPSPQSTPNTHIRASHITPHTPPSPGNPFCSWEGETKERPALHGLCKRSAPSPLLQFIKRLHRSPKALCDRAVAGAPLWVLLWM